MKHIFIMNPAAGKGKAGNVFLPRIIEASKKMEIDYEIHRTIAPGDAEHFVRSRCEAMAREASVNKGTNADIVRFYACGGDGTLNEVANGAYGYSDVEIAMIPAGTGNDFPRSFGDASYFEDIEAQIYGVSRRIDLIRYETESAEEAGSVIRYGINMFNIGLDCNVADLVGKIKQYPFVNGPLAYLLGVGIVLGKKEGVTLQILFEDGDSYEGAFMLAAIGNGRYCGGGFQGIPKAELNDGLMDVSIVDNITRRTFLSLIGKYHKGTHLQDPEVMKFLTYRQCKKLKLIPGGRVKMCTDGEISTVGQTSFEIVPNAMKFSVPQGCY